MQTTTRFLQIIRAPQRRACRVVLVVLVMSLSLWGRADAAGVVGDGTPSSCTEAALRTALNGGGSVTFNCGGPATIALATPLDISAPDTTIDGGGQITLQGNNTRLIYHHSRSSASVLTLENLTIAGGRVSGTNTAANGAGVQSVFEGAQPPFKPTLNIINVVFADNVSTLTVFTSGGSGDYGGGAVYTQGGALTVRDSTFRNNAANNGAGGAIHVLQSSLSIENSRFLSNHAIGSAPQNSLGGAIYVDGLNQGNFSLSSSTFTDNTAYNSGGAIYVNMYQNTSAFTVDRSTFTTNQVTGGTRAQGGAIGGGSTTIGSGTGNASITITNSTFNGNTVKKTDSPFDGSGGALSFPQRAVITITNATFTGNRAEGTGFNANGGAMYIVNNTTPFVITNSTIANNYAGWVGGGISNSEIGNAPGGTLNNTIIANNTAGGIANFQQQCSAELRENGHNLQFPGRLTNANYYNDVSCFVGKSAPTQTQLPDFRDPKLNPLQDNGGPTSTMALSTASPAINGGVDCPSYDQRGTARIGACDIGAFEFGGSLPVTNLPPRVYLPLAVR